MSSTQQSIKARISHVRSRYGRPAAVAWGLEHGYSVKFSRDGIIVRPIG